MHLPFCHFHCTVLFIIKAVVDVLNFEINLEIRILIVAEHISQNNAWLNKCLFCSQGTQDPSWC